MNFRTLALFILLSPITAFSQGRITGKLIDEKNNGVAFANIRLLQAQDSVLVTNSITDSVGNFSLKTPAAGNYIIRFAGIGYQVVKTEPFTITDITTSKDFGTVTIKQEDKTLANVTITSLSPNITQLADRMDVSVEGTAMAAGSNTYSVLSKAPGVFIDHEGNIQLNGRAGVMVMIDGRQTYLSARELRNMLESMPAENLKKPGDHYQSISQI